MLEERRFERLGGSKSIQVDFRLISATNRPLDQFVRDEPLPRGPLLPRQRVRDPAAVAARARRSTFRCWPTASSRATARPTACRSTPRRSRPKRRTLLQPIHWPGNIRELESTVSRAALSAPGRVDPRRRHRVPARATRCRARTSSDAAAVAARRRARAHHPRARGRRRGTRRKPRGCSTSAAARSTARSSVHLEDESRTSEQNT